MRPGWVYGRVSGRLFSAPWLRDTLDSSQSQERITRSYLEYRSSWAMSEFIRGELAMRCAVLSAADVELNNRVVLGEPMGSEEARASSKVNQILLETRSWSKCLRIRLWRARFLWLRVPRQPGQRRYTSCSPSPPQGAGGRHPHRPVRLPRSPAARPRWAPGSC